MAVAADEPAASDCVLQPEIGLPPSRNDTVPEGLLAPPVPGVTVAVYVTLAPTVGLVFEAPTLVEVDPLLTVSVWGELVELACPDPLDPVKVAVSDSGEPAAANVVVHVAVPLEPLLVTG